MLHKEIGSSFSILQQEIVETDINPEFGLDKSGVSYVSTCRNALNAIIEEKGISGGVVIIPPFTCYAVLEPFVKHEYKAIPYRIKKDLSIDVDYFKELIDRQSPKFILIHSYFGVNTIANICEYIDENEIDCTIIEDRTHSMFSNFSIEKADYCVGSIRKWLEIPEGAFIYPTPSVLINKTNEDAVLVNKGIKALNQKAKYLTSNNEFDAREHISLFSELEDYIDYQEGLYKMSASSKGIMSLIDWDSFKEKRKMNYSVLNDSIKFNEYIFKVFDCINQNEVPFMFPIYVGKYRRELQQHMVKNKIFPTIIWGCPDQISELIDNVAKSIYEEILCFPCDQRYDIEDMERICKCINEFFEGV